MQSLYTIIKPKSGEMFFLDMYNWCCTTFFPVARLQRLVVWQVLSGSSPKDFFQLARACLLDFVLHTTQFMLVSTSGRNYLLILLWCLLISQVSLAEAKSLWALVQHREFFMGFTLQRSTLSSPVRGFCGDMLAVDPLPDTPLYRLPSPTSWYYPLAAPLARSLWPSWPTRAKHAVALLEFASEIYAGDSGSFFVCDTSTSVFGVDSNDIVRMATWNHVYSYHELQSLASSRSCNGDSDCVLAAPDCRSSCDSRKQKCTLPQPSAAAICRLIKPYLLPKAPRSVAADAARLLGRCSGINASAANLSLQHAVITSELKSLLWRQISTHVS